MQSAYVEWKPRPYLDLLLPLIAQRAIRRAVVLMGPRRVGKTFLIHHAIQGLLDSGVDPRKIAYFSVDHPLYNGLGLEELLDVFASGSGVNPRTDEVFVFFDEVQYLRDWEVHLKSIVDSFPSIKAIASGSAAAALKLRSQESGAGRFTDFLLPPLTFYEFLIMIEDAGQEVPSIEREDSGSYRFDDLAALNRLFLHYLNYGGYPEVVLSPEIQEDPARFIKSDIIDKVLLRDLPSLYGIDDIQELNYLFTTLAFNTAEEVSLEPLAKNSGVAKNTLRKYIEYLEAAFLIRVVNRVDQNARRFKRVRAFKVYLTNPSIRSALFSPVVEGDEAIGGLVETAIFAQWFHSEKMQLHYARWRSGEVDIVRMDAAQNVRWVVECKWSDRYPKRLRDLAGLRSFARRNGLPSGWVTTKTIRESVVDGDFKFNFIPAAEYCYTVGRNVIERKEIALDEEEP